MGCTDPSPVGKVIGTRWTRMKDPGHLMVDRKIVEQGAGDQIELSKACPPPTHFLQLGPISKVSSTS